MTITPTTTQAVKHAFGFPLATKEARQALLVAAALSLAGMLIPILPSIVLAGYLVRLMRPVLDEGADPAMPAWDDVSGMLGDGLRVWGAHAIWMLPGILMIVAGYALYMGTAIGYPIIADNAELWNDGVFFTGMFGGMILLIVGILFTMVLSCVRLIALSHVAATGQFGKAFAFRQLWGILRRDWGGWGLIMLLWLGLQSTGQSIAVMLAYTGVCCVVAPFAGALLNAWLLLVTAGLCAGVYRGAAKAQS